jgi:hypothetical protein
MGHRYNFSLGRLAMHDMIKALAWLYRPRKYIPIQGY